jgi:lipoprotein signal peptidase
MSEGGRFPLIDSFVYITFTPNYRGFSWFVPELPEWVNILFHLLRLLILLITFPIYDFYSSIHQASRWTRIAFIALFAGVAGNLMDGLFVPYTTDFIQIIHSPSANFADLFSYMGLGVLMIEIGLYWRVTRPNWRGWRYHKAKRACLMRAFLNHLKGYWHR